MMTYHKDPWKETRGSEEGEARTAKGPEQKRSQSPRKEDRQQEKEAKERKAEEK